jgi:hypothetical protein
MGAGGAAIRESGSVIRRIERGVKFVTQLMVTDSLQGFPTFSIPRLCWLGALADIPDKLQDLLAEAARLQIASAV